MKRTAPYSNWQPEHLERVIVRHIKQQDVSDLFKAHWITLIKEAFNSTSWNVCQDFDGCTLVQDFKHPSLACLPHDYMWICGHGGPMADRIFYNLMIAEGMNKNKAFRRWLAVRVAWIVFFQWKNIIKRNWKKPTKAMIDFDNFLKDPK